MVQASNIKGVSFPIPFEDTIKFQNIVNSLDSKDEKDLLKNLKLLNDIYKSIFLDSLEDENFEKYGLNVSEQEKSRFRISFKDLVESHAYHKAYWDFFGRNQEQSKSCEILHSLTVNNNLYPYSYDNDIFKCEDFRNNIYYRKWYMMPYYMVLLSFPIEEIRKDYVNYCNFHIPYKYSASAGNWVHALFLLIIETALGIPGIEYIINEVQNGQDMKVFSPVYRFYKILDTINLDPAFLFETVEGEDFCITFFNHIAKENGWINYEKTVSTMSYSIENRAQLNHEVIVHYQLNLWREKIKSPKHFIHKIPIHIINQFSLPLLIQQDWGINIEFHMGNFIQDQSTVTDFYTEYFRSDIKKYEFLEGSNDNKEILTKIFHNSHGAIREIVNRLFAADVRQAYIRNNEYRCPLAKGGCQNCCPQCASFKSFCEVTSNCNNEILRYDKFNGYKRYIGGGMGNTPDCMYLNYMLDNGFDINNLNFK